jgi:hypothetical protein
VTVCAVLVARRPLVDAVGAVDVVQPGAGKKKAAMRQAAFFSNAADR